ncbi:hypothetical protein HDU67_003666, partial [Dinochytrium kinnereticum]
MDREKVYGEGSGRGGAGVAPRSGGVGASPVVPRENELNLFNLVSGRDKRTTVMLKNVPNRYTQEMLIEFMNETHKGHYDFIYLRMDFQNRCNVG